MISLKSLKYLIMKKMISLAYGSRLRFSMVTSNSGVFILKCYANSMTELIPISPAMTL